MDVVIEAGEKVLGKDQEIPRNTAIKALFSKKQKYIRLLLETCENIERKTVLKKERNRLIKQRKTFNWKMKKGKKVSSKTYKLRKMFAVVREIHYKRDILVEGPGGYVNSTEQKSKP